MDNRTNDLYIDPWSYRDDVSSTLDGTSIDGYDVEALDGSIGTIDEHTVEPAGGYLLVDTGFWIFGKKRVIPARVVKQVDHAEEKVYVDLTKADVKEAPDYDEAMRSDDANWFRSSSRGYYDPFVS